MGAASARILPRPRGRRLALVAGAIVLALAAGGAVEQQRSAIRTAPAVAPHTYDGMLAGVPMQRADCTNWHQATAGERSSAVRALSATIGGASTSGGFGTTLPDRQVSALFDRVCGTPGTESFVLYLIYARAAAFSRQGGGPTPITAPPADPGV